MSLKVPQSLQVSPSFSKTVRTKGTIRLLVLYSLLNPQPQSPPKTLSYLSWVRVLEIDEAERL